MHFMDYPEWLQSIMMTDLPSFEDEDYDMNDSEQELGGLLGQTLSVPNIERQMYKNSYENPNMSDYNGGY